MFTSYWLARRGGFAESEPFAWKRVSVSFRRAFLALALPLVILGGIFAGIFTATEAAAVAVALALGLGFFVYRSLERKDMRAIVVDAAAQTAVVMILVAGSAVLGWYLANQQVPERLASFTLAHGGGNTAATLLLIDGLWLAAGMVLHSAAAIVLLVPILLPLTTELGIDPIHFGLMVTVSLAIGQQTPTGSFGAHYHLLDCKSADGRGHAREHLLHFRDVGGVVAGDLLPRAEPCGSPH